MCTKEAYNTVISINPFLLLNIAIFRILTPANIVFLVCVNDIFIVVNGRHCYVMLLKENVKSIEYIYNL